MIVKAASTDVTTYFVLRKAADNTELTGATITNIDLVYTRSGADHAAKVDATALATPDAAHADNKAIEVDATSAPGLYRVDWPDAAFAAGAREVILTVIYATAFTEHLRVELSPSVDTVAISGDTTAADNCELAFDTTGYGFTNCTMPTVTALTGHTAQTGDVYANLPTNFADMTITATTGLVSINRPTGAVATDVGNSATAFKTTLTSAVNDFWKDAWLRITSGALDGQVKKVLSYNGTTKIITLASALTGTPADDVTFDLINE